MDILTIDLRKILDIVTIISCQYPLRSSPGKCLGGEKESVQSNFEFPALARENSGRRYGSFDESTVVPETLLGTVTDGSKRKIIAMTRTVVATGENAASGWQWREYDDGACAWRKTDSETGKTVMTSFDDGKGHIFVKNLRTGIETYYNGNADTMRLKNLYTGEVRFYGPNGLLMYAIRQSGDRNA